MESVWWRYAAREIPSELLLHAEERFYAFTELSMQSRAIGEDFFAAHVLAIHEWFGQPSRHILHRFS